MQNWIEKIPSILTKGFSVVFVVILLFIIAIYSQKFYGADNEYEQSAEKGIEMLTGLKIDTSPSDNLSSTELKINDYLSIDLKDFKLKNIK